MATQAIDKMSGLDITPLAPGLPFGAMVRGLTRAALDDMDTRAALHALWIDRGVILFRDGDADSDTHVALSECFGRLERHVFKESWVDGHPELVKIKYYPDDGTCYEIDGRLRGGWLPWHADLIYTDKINHGGILRPVELPPTVGHTGFIDRIAAYDRLPASLKDAIEGCHVVYGMDINFANLKFSRPESIRFVRGARSFTSITAREYQYPRVLHPMVYEQVETGRKVLNVSPAFALGIYEKGGPEGDALLRAVIDHSIDPATAYFHDWRMGDMLLWDNWRSLHCATGVEPDETRVMQRTTIAGDYALGRRLDVGHKDLAHVDV